LVAEVCYPRRTDIEDKTYFLRGSKLSIINCYQRFDLPYSGYDPDRQTVMIICPDGNPHGDRYAVPIDELDIGAIFYSRNGTAVTPQQGHAFAEYSRECWDAVGDVQLMFVDWKKLITE
jgi:chemotaxis signal transduction protein